MPKKYTFYHDPCLDGFSAAYLSWVHEGRPSKEKHEYVPLRHSDKKDNTYGFDFDKIERERAHITFLDVCPTRDDLIEFHERGIHVVIIDHHKTSINMLHDLNKNFGIEPNSLVLSEENEKSGVGLMYELAVGLLEDEIKMYELQVDIDNYKVPCYPDEKINASQLEKDWSNALRKLNIINKLWCNAFIYVQDRDLWNWKYDRTKEICAALDSYEKSFKTWDNILEGKVDSLCVGNTVGGKILSLYRDGQAICRANDQAIDMIKKSWYSLSVGEHTAAVLNSNVHQSELGNELVKEDGIDFAIIYYIDKLGHACCSLRSKPDFDCSKIAKFFGGGGHAQASGCKISSLAEFAKYGARRG